MSLRELLTDYYNLQPEESVTVANRVGMLADGFIYFNMESDNLETIQMEQAVLAYHLLENGYPHIAVPVKNMKEEWFTSYMNRKILIYELMERNATKESPGTSLARFHEIGSQYQFEPQSISSYGKWKKLWVEKVNIFEEIIHQRSGEDKVEPSVLDMFPYIIGMSENAIQYLRETEESEFRFSEVDQGTIAFFRFHDQLNGEAFWPDELCFDHPARDVAEYIRTLLLTNQSDRAIQEFIRDYQMARPLSIFGWRLVYARLLFPAHLFDAVEQIWNKQTPNKTEDFFKGLISRQGDYEERMRDFYRNVGIDKDENQLIEVDWF